MTHLGVWRITGAAVVMVGLAGCAAGADADEPAPTVLETPPEASADTGNSESVDFGGEDPEADSPDESEPTPVPASSEGPAQNWPAPDPPDEIYEPTEEGAEALLQYFYEARHYARVTGDTEPFEGVSVPGCAICDYELDVVEEVYSNDGWYVSEPDEVSDFYLRLDSDDAASGMFALKESDFETYWQGEFYGETEADSVEGFGFAMVFEDGSWQMLETTHLGEFDADLLGFQSKSESSISSLASTPEFGIHARPGDSL
ncbi:hypothetical protein FEF26_02230 [Nesterenkonia salmonea]|uniref:DUF6318 domain-containing protein n=1 Tax=Nesterenkonia salmonea TaxID=1804987 RepID=A0A5R9BGW1_9MICC|nr:DUF6318 family protein [Nesterenkonia salmonea]TLP99724.1 hypothetical protein FEF26_02230 [Nesterenkonia salmonea]